MNDYDDPPSDDDDNNIVISIQAKFGETAAIVWWNIMEVTKKTWSGGDLCTDVRAITMNDNGHMYSYAHSKNMQKKKIKY